MVRAFMEQEGAGGEVIGRIFGTTEQAGSVIFFDATPTSEVTVTMDVITPHMDKWDAKGADADHVGKADAVPADWHSPVPSQFLVCKNISLFFCVAPRITNESAFEDCALAWEQLIDALEWIGAGAKTSVGYGYMSQDDAFAKKLEVDQENAQENARKAQQSVGEAELERLRTVFDTGAQNFAGSKLHTELKMTLVSSVDWSESEQKKLAELAKQIGEAIYPKPKSYKAKFRDLLEAQPHIWSKLN
jgi:CRISPR-associated protein Cmr6